MKKINAIFRASKLKAVTQSLETMPDLTGMTISTVRGYGSHVSEKIKTRFNPLLKVPPGSELKKLEPHTKIEIICIDAIVEDVIAVIMQVARTGKAGDGKITISPINSIIRIQTGERDEEAIRYREHYIDNV